MDFSWIGKLGEAITWYKLFSLATGEAFYATVALGMIGLLAILAWKSSKLPWFTGKLALIVVAGLACVLLLALLLVVYNREIEPRFDAAPPPGHRPAPARSGPDAHAPSLRPAVEPPTGY